MGDFKDLNVYKKGLDMVKNVYAMSKKFPKEEMFGLTNQFRRAATSIVLNIAEQLGYASKEESAGLRRELEEISSMIVGLSRSVTRTK